MNLLDHQRAAPPSGAYGRLRDWIISGKLAPETQVTEPGLAQMLGLSRTPVREALTILVSEGLMTRLPTGRVMVAAVSVEEIQRIYDVRSRLEGLIARDASMRITPEDRSDLERQVVLMERLSDDYVEVVRIGKSFHQQLEYISRNMVCSSFLQQIRGHVDRYRVFTTQEPGRSFLVAAEHRGVFEAVVSGTPETAESVMRLHIDEAGKAASDWARQRSAPET